MSGTLLHEHRAYLNFAKADGMSLYARMWRLRPRVRNQSSMRTYFCACRCLGRARFLLVESWCAAPAAYAMSMRAVLQLAYGFNLVPGCV